MRNWKKQWKTELDAIIPNLDEKVLKEPIPQPEKVVSVKSSKRFRLTRGALGAIISSCAVCVLSLVIALSGIIPNGGSIGAGTGNGNGASNSAGVGDGDTNGDNGQGGVSTTFKSAMTTVEINPTVTFVMDENGIVTDVLAGNVDADVILSDTSAVNSMKGKELKIAVKSFVEYATILGYLDANGTDVVRISSVGDVLDEWVDGAKVEVSNYFNNNNIKSPLISEKVDYDTFKGRCNLGEFDDVEHLYGWAQDANELFTYREMGGKTNDEMLEYYKTNIVAGLIKDEIVDEIADYIEDFGELTAELIKFPDYWTKKDVTTDEDELERIEEIDDILEELYEDYGVVITNPLEYLAIADKIATTNLTEFITAFTEMVANGDFSVALAEIKDNFGISSFDEFDDFSADPSKLMDLTNGALGKKHGDMKKENEGKLHEEREEFDYDDFMNDVHDKIENEFGGSFDDFFNEHKHGDKKPGEGNRPGEPGGQGGHHSPKDE